MELHGDLNRFNLWVNQFRYLHNLNDYLWFILIILTGCFLINVLIKRLKINFFLGNFINFYHLSYTFFVVKYAETFAHDSNSIYSYAKGDVAAPIELKFQILKGSEFLGVILIPFARFLDLSILNLSLIFTFISSTALIYFYDIVTKINPKNKLNTLVCLFIIALPSLNFFTSGITKECLTISIFIYIFWNIINNKFFENKIVILILLIFLIFLRPYMGSILFMYLSLSLFLSKRSIFSETRFKYLKYPLYAVFSLFALYFFSFSMDINNIFSLNNISEFILNRQRLTMIGYSYNIVDTNILFRILIYIFGPIFLLSSSIFELFLVIENLIMFLLICLITFSILRNKFAIPKLNFEFYMMILFSLTMIILLSNITANFGIIARSKYNFLLIIWVFIFYLNKKNKLLK